MKIVVLLFLIISFDSFASFGMRRCALLPIKDNTPNGVLAYEVFNKLEKFLKESDWCYYHSNSDILNLLENHRRSIGQYLENPKVLSIIAKKLKAGSLIRLEIDNYLGGVKLELNILSENGKDIYFHDVAKLTKVDLDLVAEQVKSWLSIYEKTIPYNARITGVLGNQFTIDGGSSFGFQRQYDIVILRAIKAKKHPLLKQIVDWETIKIGSGKIYNITDSTSSGRIIQYDTQKKIRVGDWVILKAKQKTVIIEKVKSIDNNYKFGKLGVASIYLQTSFLDTIINSSNTKKLSGIKFGVDLITELWITRKYFLGFGFEKSFASLKTKLGTFSQNSQNISNSQLQLFGGYKYLPLGFFYGPQINAYMGYSSYTYGFDTLTSDQLTNFGFSGILVGLNGEIPFMKRFRGKVGIEFIFSPSFKQEASVLSSKDSGSSTKFKIEGLYKFKGNLDLSFKYTSIVNRELLKGNETSIEFKDSVFNFGIGFTF